MKYLAFYSHEIRLLNKGKKTAHRIWAKVNGELCCDDTPPKAAQPPFRQGEVLYIAEPWQLIKAADGPRIKFLDDQTVRCPKPTAHVQINPWLSWQTPKHMPIWAARHFVTVTRIRKERIEAISESNAAKEGYMSVGEYLNILRKKMRADRLGDYLEKNPWTWVICYVPIDVDRGRALIRTTELPPAQVNRGTVSRRAEDAVASLAEDRAKGKYGGKGKTKKGAKER